MRILLLALGLLLALSAAARPARQLPARDPFAAVAASSSTAPKPQALSDLRTVSVYALQWQGLLRYGARKMILLSGPDGRTQLQDAAQALGAEQARVLALDEQTLLLQMASGRRPQLRLASPRAEPLP